MIRRLTKIQLTLFVLITLLAVTTMAVQYVRLPSILGLGQYEVTVELPRTAGLFEQANVTYRGTKIGTVRSVRLGTDGIVATVSIDDDVEVPDNATAAVHSMSAIGEQYLDFTPSSTPAAALRDGDVLQISQVSIPVSTGELVDSVTGLLTSVPRDSLRTTVAELAEAFGGRGDTAGRLIDASRELQVEADRNRQETIGLVENLRSVLTTQDDLASPLRSLAPDVRRFTAALEQSDGDLRSFLELTPRLTAQFSDLATRWRASLRELSVTLSGVAKALSVYAPSLGHILQIMPAVVESHYSTLTPVTANNDYATLNLAFKLGVNNPPFCAKGYAEADRQRDPSDLSAAALPSESYCKVSKDDPRVVRGARNNPCPGLPGRRSADAAGCGFDFSEDR